jgi:hypothetical protein
VPHGRPPPDHIGEATVDERGIAWFRSVFLRAVPWLSSLEERASTVTVGTGAGAALESIDSIRPIKSG